MTKFFYLFGLYLMMVSCNYSDKKQQVSSIPTISITGETIRPRTVKLSEFMEIEKIVPIETRPDVLIPAENENILRYAITKESIVIFTYDVLQFSHSGKYMRTLAHKGKGPQEFTGIEAYAIDEEKDLLYYSNYHDKFHITAIDLKTGKHLSKIPLPLKELGNEDGMHMEALLIGDNHSIICAPEGSSGLFTFFSITPSGEFLSGKKIDTPTYNGMYFRNVKGNILFKPADSDTIYRINNWLKIPEMVVSIKNFPEVSKAGIESNTTLWRITHEGPNFLIVSFKKQHVFAGGPYKGATANFLEQNFLLFKNGESVIMENILIDPFGYSVASDKYIPATQSGDYFIFKLDAFEFKENLKKVLSSDSADQTTLARVKEFDAKVFEDDNPVLVIGTMK